MLDCYVSETPSRLRITQTGIQKSFRPLTGPQSAVRPVRPWPDHFFCQENFFNYSLPFKVIAPLRQHFDTTWPDHFSKADYDPDWYIDSGECTVLIYCFRFDKADCTNIWSGTAHIDKISATASTRLYFLKHLKGAGLAVGQLRHFCLSAARPMLEYCCVVWHHGLTKAQSCWTAWGRTKACSKNHTFEFTFISLLLPSVLWRSWLCGRKGIRVSVISLL